MANDRATTLSEISAPWRIVWWIIGGVGAALMLAVSVATNLALDNIKSNRALIESDTDKTLAIITEKEKALKDAIGLNSGFITGINISLAKEMERTDTTIERINAHEQKSETEYERLRQLESRLDRIEGRCSAAQKDIEEVKEGLKDEIKFCRQSVLPTIEEVRNEMHRRFKELKGG